MPSLTGEEQQHLRIKAQCRIGQPKCVEKLLICFSCVQRGYTILFMHSITALICVSPICRVFAKKLEPVFRKSTFQTVCSINFQQRIFCKMTNESYTHQPACYVLNTMLLNLIISLRKSGFKTFSAKAEKDTHTDTHVCPSACFLFTTADGKSLHKYNELTGTVS